MKIIKYLKFAITLSVLSSPLFSEDNLDYQIKIKSDGTLWASGDNSLGQLGDGTNTTRISPLRIGKDTNWAQVALGFRHVIAVKSNGTLWSWGSGRHGELGQGNCTYRSVPTQIGISSNWGTNRDSIAAGWRHSFALKTDGTLWAWGDNWAGQLGLKGVEYRSIPVQVGTDTDWVKVFANRLSSLLVKKNGTYRNLGYTNEN